MNTTRHRLLLAAAATGALAAVVGLAIMGVGHDEPRLVRTAGVSAPLEQAPADTTPSTPAPTPEDAQLDATVKNHEARIGALESTTTTAPAALRPAPTTTGPAAPVVEAQPATPTTSAPSTTTTQPAPTTTTTFRGPPWWCPVQQERGQTMVPCDSTTTTTQPV